MKQRQLKESTKITCPQIWNIEKAKDRENEKVGDRLEKLNKKKSDKELEREIKNKKETNFVGRTTWKFYTGCEKMRDASGLQGENER